MTELLNNYLYIIILYFPLGVIGIWRWSVWMTKKVVAKKYRPVNENGYNNTLSIVVPVYNEDPDIFQKALESWVRNNPDEIIAVIDYTDEACIEKFKKFQEGNKNSELIITKRPGKREALSDGIKRAQYNIIALVDSDTIWDPNIKDILLAPFNDPSVGGVGSRQSVLDTNTLARRLFNMYLGHKYFDEMAYLATVGNALTCISGRTALYRKEAIKDLCEELENETFWGVKCISGDDKCITRLVQERGWGVRYQANARVLTPGAPDVLTFLKQHIRWTRNSYRSDLKSLMSKWVWKKEKFLAYHMVDRFTQPFTLILGPMYFIFSILWGHWVVAGILLVWWHFSRGIKLYPHLKQHPSDIVILQFYIFTTYLLAILKIYALVTIRQQGWITRWDKNRLQIGINNIFRVLKSTVSYSATAFIIFLLSFSIIKYKDFSTTTDYTGTITLSDVESINVDQHKQVILHKLKSQQRGYYTVKKGDTLSEITRRYNGNLNIILEANKETIPYRDYINTGQLIIIPVSELRNTLNKGGLIFYGNPSVIFDELQNTIIVEGKGSIVTLSKIYNVLNNERILQKLDNKEWILRANLFVKNGATLMLEGADDSWLKLKSDKNGFVWLRSKNGNILIQNTKITSWDEGKHIPDTEYEDGRSFILAEQDGRMDVINSELAFLGYDGNNNKLQAQISGGVYGVSWKIPRETFTNTKRLMTGSALHSKFHDNYFGIYAYGVTGMIIENNEVFNNIQYGIDPHDESNNLIINGNRIYSNGNHGIIISKFVFNNTISENTSYNNKLHGIMLDHQSNNNLVENNITYGNIDGIVIYNSHNNLIRSNKIRENKKSGIRTTANSSNNYFEQNVITNNEDGIFIDDANNNFVISNLLQDNVRGVYIKKVSGNLLKNSLKRWLLKNMQIN